MLYSASLNSTSKNLPCASSSYDSSEKDLRACAMGTPAVMMRGVRKSFEGSIVLRDLNLDVRRGEFLGIVGASGCGKSTLLKILAGLDSPDSGQISIDGRSCDGMEPGERDIAMVFQNHALYPQMTARQNIALPLMMRRLNRWQRLPGAKYLSAHARTTRNQIYLEIDELAKSLAIDHVLARKPSKMSGGQRQRVALARAMIRHPAVFLMDEPLSSLDAKLRIEMRSEISALHRRLGAAFIYVTHDQSEAMTMADRVAVMSGGRFLQVAPPRVLYSDPEHLEVAQLIGTPTINCFSRDGAIGHHVLQAHAGFPSDAVHACIRPEHIKLSTDQRSGLRGEVLAIEDHGADLYVRVSFTGGEILTLRGSTSELSALAVGATVSIQLAAKHLLLFGRDGMRIRKANAETPV
jgi:multiple sugar transport system ATP-binding protein